MFKTLFHLPQLSRTVWILFFGRLLSAVGTGFVLFYSSIFFTSEVGFSYTEVGLGLAAGSVSGVVGRFLGGSLSDTPGWGRRRTLLLSLGIAALGAALFALSTNFVLFTLANLVAGFSVGLYWPASESAIADLTTPAERGEAYGLTRGGDSLGLGLGAALGAALIAFATDYRLLFWLNGLSYLLFFAVVFFGVAETRPVGLAHRSGWSGWREALGDRDLLIYALVNVCFTTLVAQMESTLPVYLRSFAGLATTFIGGLFAAHVALIALVQLPIARLLSSWSRSRGLMIAAVLWAVSFLFVLAAGTLPGFAGGWTVLALAGASLATAAYNPSASALVADLAPPALRGTYLSLNSQCWAIGYAVGPALGGYLLDQPRPLSDLLWPGLSLLILATIPLLGRLDRLLDQKGTKVNRARPAKFAPD